jgi:hypothetical protein
MDMGMNEKRCPVCGRGELVDILYTGGSPREEPKQGSDTRQIETYSCGHERIGAPLDEAASPESDLGVEHRTTEETVDSPEPGPNLEPGTDTE